MKHRYNYLLSIVIFLGTVNLSAQPGNFKQVMNDEIIEVSGETLRFEMRNVCYEGLIFGISAIDTIPAKVLSIDGSYDNTIFFEKNISNEIITGVAGDMANFSSVVFSTMDTLYAKRYAISWGQITLTDSFSFHIPNIKSLKGGDGKYWVIHEQDNKLQILKVFNTFNQTAIKDTIPLEMENLYFFEHEDYFQHNNDFHIVGRKSDSTLFYYKLNTNQTNLDYAFSLDTIPGEIKFVSGNKDKTFFISQLNDTIFTTDFYYDTESLQISKLTQFDSVRDISIWSDYGSYVALLSPVLDTTMTDTVSVIHLYDYKTWNFIQSHYYESDIRRIYALPGYSMSLQTVFDYKDDSVRYIAPLDYNNIIQHHKRIQIPQWGVDAYDITGICFTGIDETELQEVKTYIYPNPASQQVNIVVKNVPCDREHQLFITDLSGKTVYNTSFFAKENYSIPVHHLASGMYILTLQIDGKNHSRKLMVR